MLLLGWQRWKWHNLPGGGGALGIHAASFGRSEALKAQRLIEVTLSNDEKIGRLRLPSLATWKFHHHQVDKGQAVSENTRLSHTVHVNTCHMHLMIQWLGNLSSWGCTDMPFGHWLQYHSFKLPVNQGESMRYHTW